MISQLGITSEVRAIQNPALGAVLLWRCCVGYEAGNSVGDPVPIPLLFIVLPILYHEQTATLLVSTQQRSGLRKFTEKFQTAAESKTDLVLAINSRAHSMRRLTRRSLQIALAQRLISIDPAEAAAFALSRTAPWAGIAPSARRLLRQAEKLGNWFGELSLYEVSLLLQVRF